MAEPGGLTARELARHSPAQAQTLSLPEMIRAIDAAADAELREAPRALLHLARALEPSQRLAQRTAALDRLDRLLHPGDPIVTEVTAERAIDLVRQGKLDEPEQIALDVLTSTGDVHEVARARATEALGRVQAWRGDEMSARRAAVTLADAAERYRRLECTEWQAFVVFWTGNAVYYQWGDLPKAESDMRAALAMLPPSSPRRAVLLTFLAEVLTTRGEWPQVEAVLAEAVKLAAAHEDVTARAYVTWQQARVASLAGDAATTERFLAQTEQHRADWFDVTSGSTYLADAAELLDRVGLTARAAEYLQRAQAMDPDDEFVLQAEAALLARHGDPTIALAALRSLAHRPWLEPRLAWRRSMLSAYASLRAGRSADAGMLAARALEQAAALGDPRLAEIGEPEVTRTLVPLAAAHGSPVAQRLLAPAGSFVIRVLGTVSVTVDDVPVPLPTGRPGTLVRLLAARATDLDVEVVIDTLWPDVDVADGQRRLRGVLARLRSRVGPLVTRTESRLSLAAGWVDAWAFRAAVDRAVGASAASREALARSALAMWGGDLLPSDPYEAWAAGPREELRRLRITLLDIVAADTAARGSMEEACYALEQAIDADPYDETRYIELAAHLQSRGRREPARRALERAVDALAALGLDPTPPLVEALRRSGPPRH